jgi:hypothetical protein
MLGDALEYPARGEDALTTVLVGGLLPVLSVLFLLIGLALSVLLIGLVILPLALLPGLALFGYYVAVLRGATSNNPDPPRFREWKRLIGDGGRFLVISIAYGIPFVVLSGVFFVVLAASEATVGNTAAEAIAAVIAAITALLAVCYLLVYAYIQPLAMANFAREDRLRSAFDLAILREVGLSKAYALAWLLSVPVWLVGGALEGSLWFVLIGLFIGFYADVVRYYLYGRGLHDALNPTTRHEPVEPAHETRSDRFVPATERLAEPIDEKTIPRIEESSMFKTRTGTLDAERGWTDWETDDRE